MPASAGQAAENQRGDSDSRADLPGNHLIEALFDYLLQVLGLGVQLGLKLLGLPVNLSSNFRFTFAHVLLYRNMPYSLCALCLYVFVVKLNFNRIRYPTATIVFGHKRHSHYN